MRKFVLLAAAGLSSWSVALSADPQAASAPAASPADDATKFLTTIIDKFNGGDVKGWVAAQDDNATIVDEFGPHVWSGPGSAQRWLDDYTKDAVATGVTGGRVDYSKPLQATSDGTTAYIVLPTTYRFLQKGAKMAEPGSMTFVMKRSGADWKIASWTYSAGGAPAPEK
ncbi:MAG: nuclear transport factor 2 family protein [Sphingomonas sp.]